jgi:tetratricopeptide (TPR) repeat protein
MVDASAQTDAMIGVVMVISLEESQAQIDRLWERARTARRSGDLEAALEALRTLLDHPCAHHQVVEHEVLDETYVVLRELGRLDEAIDAKRRAIAAGYRSTPDPEADIAECLIESGNRAEGDALFEVLRDRTPDDPWLYNSAGFAYRGVDDRVALRWLLDGIDVAIESGDHDQVAAQLMDMAVEQWERLGEPADEELVARVDDFIANWTRPAVRSKDWPDASTTPALRLCEHCGFDPNHPAPARDAVSTASGAAGRIPLSLAWFPAAEWELAIDRWPDLLDDLPADHRSYSRRIEARLKWLTRHAPGHSLSVSPLTVDELDEARGADANTGEARSWLAAEVARRGRALDWPPARNDRCWCGSGQKYKKCCGPVPPAEDEQ